MLTKAKKNISLLVVAAMILSMCLVESFGSVFAAANLVNNPGFESQKTGWYELGPSTATSVVTSGANGTSYTLRIGTGEGGMGQKVTASAGTSYTLSGWGKVSTTGEVAYLGVDCMDSAGTKLAGGKFEVTFTTSTFTSKSITFTAVTGTTQLQVYTYKNPGSGYAYLDEISLTTGSVLSAPSGLQAGTPTSSTIPLSWNPVAGATGYKLYRDNSVIYSGSAASYNDTGLTAGTTYSYKVSATNSSGESAQSAAVSAVTAASGGTGATMVNPGFESQKTGWYELGASTVTSVETPGANGTAYTLKIGTGEGGMGQKITATAGTSYTLSGWGKVSTSGEVAYLGVDCMNSAGTKIAGGKFEVTFTTTAFSKKSLTLTAVEGTAQIQIYTYKNGGAGYAYIDEISINSATSGAGAQAFLDDFTGSSVDTARWEVVNQVWGTGNNGVIPENVSVSNGMLCVRGNGDLYSGVKRTGGCIKTVGSNYASGSYEVKMKVLPQMGALSAMWTYYNDGTINHEIDIEMPGNTQNFNYVLCTDWIQAIESNTYRTTQLVQTSTPQNDGEWHVYRFDWHTNPKRVDYYRDGVLLTSQTTTVPNHGGNFWVGVWFPNNWSGTPNFATDYMYVDYVKFTPFNESGDAY